MAAIIRLKRKKPHLNMTPLIDVIFLLIIFFMLTSKFSLDQAIETELAPVSNKVLDNKVSSNTVLILLEESEGFKLWSKGEIGNSSIQPMSSLQSVVESLLTKDKNRELIVVVHEKNNVQQAVAVLSSLRRIGAKKVRLAEGK